MSKSGSARSRVMILSGVASTAVFAVTLAKSDAVRADSSGGPKTLEVQRLEPSLEPLPYPTQRRNSSESRSNAEQAVRAGINDEPKVTYKVTEVAGFEVKREALPPPSQQKPEKSKPYMPAYKPFGSRGIHFTGAKVVQMIATGYSPSPRDNGGSRSGLTATGRKIAKGVVAVDPKVIPLGTRLYVEGYGYAVAADTGGAIKGRRIDLAHDTHREANSVGRKTVTVHILSK